MGFGMSFWNKNHDKTISEDKTLKVKQIKNKEKTILISMGKNHDKNRGK